MLCESCKTALRIKKCYMTVEGDSDPAEKTRLYRNLELCCPNRKCRLYGRAVKLKNEVEIEKGESENA